MKQLAAQDASFLYSETASTPMHICGLSIYDQSTAPGGRLSHKGILSYIEERLHLGPQLRQRLVQVPMDLDHPYWIKDPDFDLEFHVRHIALPSPGDWRQLCIFVSRINSRPIDFDRPPWEAYIIEGLDNIEGLPPGSFALFTKVHHTLVDGQSGQNIFGVFHDLSPDATASRSQEPIVVERAPGSAELLLRAIPNQFTRPAKNIARLGADLPGLVKTGLELYRGQRQSGAHMNVPQTRFNREPTPHRVFEGTHFPMDALQQIKRSVAGAKLNDVMAALVAGGLRRYLQHHNELPEEPLGVTMPVDLRNKKAPATAATTAEPGNQVGSIFMNLHTDIEAGLDRIAAIHESSILAKALFEELDVGKYVMGEMSDLIPPALNRRMHQLMSRYKLLDRVGMIGSNLLITNVAGPRFALYHAGAKMQSYWGLPPLMSGMALSHCVFSQNDNVSLSVVSCREIMPDPAFYMQCCNESFEELLAAAKTAGDAAAATDEAEVQPVKRKKAVASKRPRKRKAAGGNAAKAADAKKAVKKASAKPPARRSTAASVRKAQVNGLAAAQAELTPTQIARQRKLEKLVAS